MTTELIEMYGSGKTRQSVRYSLDDEDEPLMNSGGDSANVEHQRIGLDTLFPSLPNARRLVQQLEQTPHSQSEESLIGTRVRHVDSESSMNGALDPQKSRPIGDIVVKVKRGKLVVLPHGVNQYYTWELHEGLSRQTVLLLFGLAIIVFAEAIFPKAQRHNSTYPQVVAGQMGWAMAALVPFWLGLFLIAKMRPARVGRLAALQMLAPVQGFHFMLSYCRSNDGGHAGGGVTQVVQDLGAVLTANRCNVWVDRLVNAQSRHQAAYHAAKQAAFLIIFLTPEYTRSVDCCLELLVALDRPPADTVFYVSPSSLTPPLVQVLRSRGFTVCATVTRLVAVLDEILISADACHGEWWREQPLVMSPRLRDSDTSPTVKLCRSRSFSLTGRLFVPAHGISSGLHYLTGDGRTVGSLVRAPLPLLLCAISAGVGLWGCLIPLVHGIYPYVSQWQLFTLFSVSAMRSIVKCSDSRLYHSSALLPVLLAQHELRRLRARVVFVVEGEEVSEASHGHGHPAPAPSAPTAPPAKSKLSSFNVGAIAEFLGTLGVDVEVQNWGQFHAENSSSSSNSSRNSSDSGDGGGGASASAGAGAGAASASASASGASGTSASGGSAQPLLFVFFVTTATNAQRFLDFHDDRNRDRDRDRCERARERISEGDGGSTLEVSPSATTADSEAACAWASPLSVSASVSGSVYISPSPPPSPPPSSTPPPTTIITTTTTSSSEPPLHQMLVTDKAAMVRAFQQQQQQQHTHAGAPAFPSAGQAIAAMHTMNGTDIGIGSGSGTDHALARIDSFSSVELSTTSTTAITSTSGGGGSGSVPAGIASDGSINSAVGSSPNPHFSESFFEVLGLKLISLARGDRPASRAQ